MVGFGQPEVLHPSGQEPGSTRARRRCRPSGRRGLVLMTVSMGRPRTYFGITQAPLRVEINTRSATPLRESSETMSTALLPIPTTSTRLP